MKIPRKDHSDFDLQKMVINDLIKWMDENRQVFPSVTEVIERSGYSRWYFQRMFKKRTGITLGVYLRKRKMAVIAKDWLYVENDLTDIAEKYGYSCAGAFSQAFRRNFGMTPREWKGNHLNGYSYKSSNIKILFIECLA